MKSLYNRVMTQKFRPLFLSLLFLMVSMGTYQLGTNYLAPSVIQASIESPAGTWQQFVVDEGEPFYLGTFSYTKVDGDFKVEAEDVGPLTYPQSDFRTFSHTFDGTRWGFHSDWHERGVAWFELKKVDEGRFEGYAYLDGHRLPNRHILVRVNP